MDTLKRFLGLNNGNRLKVAVAGDTMIDEYYYTSVNRISPEFPIPVMLSPNDKADHSMPGGAANVAYQFSRFNVEACLVGLANEYAAKVYQGKMKCQYAPICNCQVPIKHRFYQGEFPLCRWDIERPNYGLNEQDMRAYQAHLDIPDVDVILFSDYNKGTLTGDWYKQYIGKTITIVDPKDDLSKWRGCTIIKPNSVEAEKLTGQKDWHAQCDSIQKKTDCESVVITQGGSGVVGWSMGKYFKYRSRHKPDNVNSVIGAGDCFMAFLAMAVGHGMSLLEASEVAYEAGALYVQNKHNEPIKPHQFSDALECKLVHPDEFQTEQKLVFTNGVFDVLHSGHLKLLQFAKKQGDVLMVAVNSDDSVRRLKGEGRPVNDLVSRMRLLAALDMVDYVTFFSEDTPWELINKIKPDVLVKGGDYKKEDIVGADIVPEVYICPHEAGVSTTKILEKLNS